jgi:hypothetical protein
MTEDKKRMAKCPACCKEVEFVDGTHQCQELKEYPYCGGFAYILEDCDLQMRRTFNLDGLSALTSELSKKGFKNPLFPTCEKKENKK